MAKVKKEVKILMIEDDLTLCDLVGSFLEKKGYVFYQHNTFEGAIDRVKQVRPDLIIMDLHFPDGNGLHLCKTLKDDKDYNKIPILVLTGRDYPVEKEVAMKSGVTDFFHKPMVYSKLTEKIDEILGESIKLTFWGVRGSVPCPGAKYAEFGGNSTCLQVKIPGQKKMLIIDAGTGLRVLGDEVDKSVENCEGRIFLTHAHWDHIQGFPFFKPLYKEGNKFQVHMPQQISGSTKEVLVDKMSYTYSPITSHMFKADLEYLTQTRGLQRYDGYSVEHITANHPVETAIYKFEIGKRSFVFAPDNELSTKDESSSKGKSYAYLKQFDSFVSGVDVLIHDSQFDYEEYQHKQRWGHSAWEIVVERSIKNGVKHLILTHFGPDLVDDDLFRIEEEAQEMARGTDTHVELAREGKVFRFPA